MTYLPPDDGPQVPGADAVGEEPPVMNNVHPGAVSWAYADYWKRRAERAERERDLWLQVWDALNEMGAALGDANKPLSVTASWALLRSERDAAQRRLAGENERLKARLPCGHHKEAWDDSYGGCVFCGYKKAADECEVTHQVVPLSLKRK